MFTRTISSTSHHQSYACEVTHSTVIFHTKSSGAAQTVQFSGSDVVYNQALCAHTCLKFQFFSKIVDWLYVPSKGHITTHKMSPELGPKTVFFSHKTEIAT